jgi:hypothetical protein
LKRGGRPCRGGVRRECMETAPTLRTTSTPTALPHTFDPTPIHILPPYCTSPPLPPLPSPMVHVPSLSLSHTLTHRSRSSRLTPRAPCWRSIRSSGPTSSQSRCWRQSQPSSLPAPHSTAWGGECLRAWGSMRAGKGDVWGHGKSVHGTETSSLHFLLSCHLLRTRARTHMHSQARNIPCACRWLTPPPPDPRREALPCRLAMVEAERCLARLTGVDGGQGRAVGGEAAMREEEGMYLYRLAVVSGGRVGAHKGMHFSLSLPFIALARQRADIADDKLRCWVAPPPLFLLAGIRGGTRVVPQACWAAACGHSIGMAATAR